MTEEERVTNDYRDYISKPIQLSRVSGNSGIDIDEPHSENFC